MERFGSFAPGSFTGRGVDPLDADATGALARLASDAQVVERAIGGRFSGASVVASFNRALQTDVTGPHGAWPDFYLALARFLNVATRIAALPPAPDALAAFVRLQMILADDLGQRLLAASERRRLKRQVERLAKSTPAVGS
jgi:hypothetical protein